MKIDKVVWNSIATEYSVAKVGHTLMQSITRNLPKVTSIEWCPIDNKSIYISLDDNTRMQILHPDEVYYVPE